MQCYNQIKMAKGSGWGGDKKQKVTCGELYLAQWVMGQLNWKKRVDHCMKLRKVERVDHCMKLRKVG